MKQRSLLLFFHLIALTTFAQRPDSVQVNGEWFFVYPLQEKLQPSDILLDKLDLSEVQFELFKEWKLTNDPRLNLSKNKMIDSLNAELIRTKVIVSKAQNSYRWRNDTRAPKLVRAFLLRKKHWYRNNSELLVDGEIDQNYDLVPAVQNLPNGKYIQYFEPMLSYHEWKKTKELPTKVAAVFELKNNLLENEFTRFNYRSDTIRHGYFTDGLKEKQWKLYDRGTYLSFGLHGLTKRNTLFLYKSWITVELKKGILDGPFWSSEFRREQPAGYFKNGYADSNWISKPYYSWRTTEVFDYNSVLDSNYIQQLSMTITPSFGTGRKCTKEFDFKEKKNDYHTTSYYDCQEDRFQQGVPAIPLIDFADLFEHPTRSGLSRLRTTNENGSGNYRNTGHVNFHGTKEVFDQNQLTERYTYLPELGSIVYARFFKNGAVFDTLGFDPRDSVFVHNVFDANGKIFQTSTYNTSGEWLQQINYYHEKERKIKYETPVLIEGFETMSDYHSGKKFRYWKGDLIVDGKRYTDIEWYAKTKKRSSETYIDTSDLSIHDVIYNSKEEAVVEHVHFLVKLDSLGNQNTVQYGTRDIVNIGTMKLTQEKVRDVKSPVVLTCSDQPYSGKLDIRFSDGKLNLEDQVIDGLQWTIPWNETSKSLHKQFVEFYANDNDYPIPSGYSYFLQKIDNGNLFSYLLTDLFHGQFGLSLITRMEGEFQNGKPSGNWNYYNKKGTLIFTLNFANGLPNGEAVVFTYYEKPSHYDRKYDQDQPYYSFLYSKDAPKTYREQTYHFVNGKLDGPHVVYTAMGDTMKVTEYKLGEFHGGTWERLEDNVFLTEYQNGERHGIRLNGKLEYNDKKEVVLDTVSLAHYENGRLHGDCYFEFFENDDEGEDYGGGDRIQVSHYRSYQVQKNVRCHFQQGLLQGNYVQRKESGETEFSLGLNTGLVDSLTFFENGAPSYYYDYAEEERLLPYRFSDTLAMHLGSRFFYNPNLSFLTYDESEDVETRYGRMARENPYGRSGFNIEDYKQGRFTKLYPNGKIARRGYRIDDKNWGDWDFYNYDGQRLYSIDYGTQTVVLNGVTYSEAEIKGKYAEYDSLGNEICKGFLIEELEKYDCAHSDYYAIRQFVITEDKKDSYERTNGPMRYYFDNGMLMSEGTLKNGMPDGVWKFYTPDGKLTRIGKYVNGKKEGRWLKGDLGDKKYIGEICLNPDDPLLDFHIAELERLRDVEIVIYKNGLAQILQQYEVTD